LTNPECLRIRKRWNGDFFGSDFGKKNMTPNSFFESFNHCLVTKDSEQIRKSSSNIQCFKSRTFGDGNFYHGPEAPSAFRLSLNQIIKSRTKYSMEVLGRTGTEKAALFVVNLKKASVICSSVISLGVSGNQLIYFIETVVSESDSQCKF